MGNFPNAKTGMGHYFKSQIFHLIATAAAAIGSIVAVAAVVIGAGAATSGEGEAAAGAILGGGAAAVVFAIVSLVFGILALVFAIRGLGTAGKDNAKFTYALITLGAGFVLQAIGNFTGANNVPVLPTICKAIAAASDILLMYFVIFGVIELIPTSKSAETGKMVYYIITAIVALELITMIISSAAPAVALAFTIISSILGIVGGIMFLVFLNRAKNEL